jgi:hypothetical protein
MADTQYTLSSQPLLYALSIQQPWAWLIADGIKDIENRKWSTSFRGPFFVHAGKRFDQSGYEWLISEMGLSLPKPGEYALGGIVGKATVIDCVRSHYSRWFFGPYGFILAGASPLPFIPLRGQLGFFRVSSTVAATAEGKDV